jgi:hypothetical protein
MMVSQASPCFQFPHKHTHTTKTCYSGPGPLGSSHRDTPCSVSFYEAGGVNWTIHVLILSSVYMALSRMILLREPHSSNTRFDVTTEIVSWVKREMPNDYVNEQEAMAGESVRRQTSINGNFQ